MWTTSNSKRTAALTLAITLLTVTGSISLHGESAKTSFRELIEELDPMGLHQASYLDEKTAGIISRYYKENFTSESKFREIESVRFDGIIHTPDAKLEFSAFKKKPDLSKVVITFPNGDRTTMSYDGADAWKQVTSGDRSAIQTMSTEEAMNFTREATIGGHLLFPGLPGKTITLGAPVTVDGHPANVLHIELPDGQEIELHIEAGTMVQRRRVLTNAVTGQRETITLSDYQNIEGMKIPFLSITEKDGQQINEVEVTKVEFNAGVMPWFFSRSSEDYTVAAGEAPRANASKSSVVDDAPGMLDGKKAGDPAASKSFRSMNPEEIPSILEDISQEPILNKR